MKKVLYGRYSKGTEKTITTTPPALAVNTYPTYAKSFELQGKSLVLNQLIQNGNFVDGTNWGYGSFYPSTYSFSNNTAVITPTGTGFDILQILTDTLTVNHKYYFAFLAKTTVSVNIQARFAGATNQDVINTTCGTSYTEFSTIFTSSYANNKLLIYSGVLANTQTAYLQNVRLVDLTQMYGAGFEPTTVGQAKVVLGDKYIPYNPGTFIHNNATYEVNKWNQLVKNGNFESLSQWVTGGEGYTINNNTVTFTATSQNSSLRQTSWTITNGHKYLVYGEMKLTTGTTSVRTCIYDGSSVLGVSTANTTDWQVVAGILTATNSTTSGQFQFIRDGRSSGWDAIQGRNSMCIDLTDIFGAGKEPSTVDECKLRFLSMGIDITKYQPYSPLGGQYCGYRNIWDEEWEILYTNYVFSKNYIPVNPQTSYYYRDKLAHSSTIYWYNQNKVQISYTNFATNNTFTTPTDCYYIKINYQGTTYNKNDISIYQVSNKVDLGFNIWDEEWELGDFLDNGTEYPDNNRIRAKNYIPAMPSTTYYRCAPQNITVYFYDITKTGIGKTDAGRNNTFACPQNCAFMRFSVAVVYGTNYNHDICINLSQTDTTKSPHNGDYRPYLMLRGIGSDFNIFDEIWTANTALNDSGETFTVSNYSTTDWIAVLPNTKYYITTPATDSQASNCLLARYDKDKAFVSAIRHQVTSNWSNREITIPDGVYYIRFYIGTAYTRVCVNLSQPQTTINPHNGQYVPHLFDTYDSMSGILTRRIGAVDLGTLTWSFGENHDFYTPISGITGIKQYTNNRTQPLVCTKYDCISDGRPNYETPDKTIYNTKTSGVLAIMVRDSSYSESDLAAFQAAMKGTMLLYELNAYHVFTPTSKVGVVDMGSLSWTRVDVTGSGGYVFSTPATPLQMYKQSDNLWCSGYTTCHYTGTGSTIYNYGNKIIAQHSPSGEFNIYVRDDSYTSASDFTNAVKGMTLTYELSDSVSQTTITQPISFVAGKLGKQYGVVDLGSLTWTYTDVTKVFMTPYSPVKPVSNANVDAGNIICSIYRNKPYGYIADHLSEDMMIGLNDNATNVIRIRNLSYSDTTAFKNSLQGQYLIYELVDGATGMTYATAGNLIRKTNGDVGDVDFNLTYNTLLNENKFLISYNMGTSQSPDKRLINVGGILNA